MTTALLIVLLVSLLINAALMVEITRLTHEKDRLRAKLQDGEVLRPREAHGDAPVMMRRLRQDR